MKEFVFNTQFISEEFLGNLQRPEINSDLKQLTHLLEGISPLKWMRFFDLYESCM